MNNREYESIFLERRSGFDHSTVDRRVLADAPQVEKHLRQFQRPHCGSIRVDDTHAKIRGTWRYLDRAIDKYGTFAEFRLTTKCNLDATKRCSCKALQDWHRRRQALPNGDFGGVEGGPDTRQAHTSEIEAFAARNLKRPISYQKDTPKISALNSFASAKRTIAGSEAMLWLKKSFGFAGDWTVRTQNKLLTCCFELQRVNEA